MLRLKKRLKILRTFTRLEGLISEPALGPLLALVGIFILRYSFSTPAQQYVPYPVTLLTVIVIYSVFQGGIASGMLSALMTISYFAYFLKISGGFASAPGDAWNRLISWSVALPIIVGLVGALKRRHDFHNQEETEAKVQGYRQRVELIVSNTPAVFWAVDINGIFTFSEGMGLKLVGLKPGERLGQSIFDLYGPSHEVVVSMRKALAGEPCKAVYQVKGFWFETSFSPTRDIRGKIVGVVGVGLDVTSRLESESAKAQLLATEKSSALLRETTRRLQTLINSSPVAILTLDKDNKVTIWNPACERMFGWSAAEAIGGPLPFVPPDKTAESVGIINKISQTYEPVHFEGDRIKKDGTAIMTGVAAIPLLDERGQVSGIMAVMMDNTERFRAQQEILEANRALRSATQAKSDFLANMSHEIRTPINGVIGTTGLLLDMELGTEQKSYAETIRSSAEILLNLVNDILDFSKIESGKIDLEVIDFDLEQVTHNIERLLSVSARKKGLRLLRSISHDLPTTLFKGDPTRIGQILANLISNAIKFTASGQIVVELLHDRLETMPADSKRVQLRIEVTDTGIGMSEEALSRVFQPFTQADASTNRRFGGTGLGLSISKRLVEMMDGQIGVRSKEGEGSTFWFTLVLEKSDKKQLEREFSPDFESEDLRSLNLDKPLRILVADDNAVNQIIAVKTLEKSGFRVDAVANGKEAIEALNTVPYDLVLMDCQMPELDGYEATRKIRQVKDVKVARIPIIAMTANAMSDDRERCLESGMNDYVTKPIKGKDLVKVIQMTLRKYV